jgi:hypothetical protein
MKKTTVVKVISTLVLTLIIAPAITAQAATIPFLSSIFDTIQAYVPIVNSILASGTPTVTDIANSKDAISNKSTYGSDIDLTGVAVDSPLQDGGEINFDETNDDAINVKLATGDSNSKTRTMDEFQSVSELTAMESASLWTSKSAKKLDSENQSVVSKAKDTITSAKNIVSSQPIGTCDSSLCAENTYNVLLAQQIELDSAAISLAITSNAYSKINNIQQAILVKNEQEKKAEEAAKARLESINSSSSLINRINANRLIRTIY